MKPLLKASDEAEFKRLYTAYMGNERYSENVWHNLQIAGIAEKPLEEGWYWCQLLLPPPWLGTSQTVPCHWDRGIWWIPTPDGRQSIKPNIIGPRILPPSQEGTDGK